MKFFCNSCENDREFETDFSILVIEKWGYGVKRYCRMCRSPKSGLADVFWDGKPEENLADGPDGKPRVFSSKGEKAAYLRSKGIMEAGDRVHGSAIEVSKQQAPRLDSKHEVQMALRKVKEMGRDNRRQAYLKIVKEQGGRYVR